MTNWKNSILIVTLILSLAGCKPQDASNHEHHDAGMATSAAHGHGHEHGGGIVVTHYTNTTELFVEYDPLIKEEESAFAAHLTLTKPEGFQALNQGTLTVLLEDEAGLTDKAESTVSATPGIFRPVIRPQKSGKRNLKLKLTLPDRTVIHDLGEVTVYADHASADHSKEEENTSSLINFTKEQQWKIPFATQVVNERVTRESIPVVATVKPAPDREAIIAAPEDGLLRPSKKSFPKVGDVVSAGQVVAFLSPKLGGDTDFSTLKLSYDKARIAYDHASVDRERLEKLYELEAIPEKKLRDAVQREKLAKTELISAKNRLNTFKGAQGGIALKSPIKAKVISVNAISGSSVITGQNIMYLANLNRLWFVAHVPEGDIGNIDKPTGAFFNMGNNKDSYKIDVKDGAKLIAYGGLVDPKTRTVPAIFEFPNSDGQLQAGMNVQASLYTGKVSKGIALPASAVIDNNGTPVVYVLNEGESFERRVITLGYRDGDWVIANSGLIEGERIVTLGAYQVHLAATAPAAIGHGHAH